MAYIPGSQCKDYSFYILSCPKGEDSEFCLLVPTKLFKLTKPIMIAGPWTPSRTYWTFHTSDTFWTFLTFCNK